MKNWQTTANPNSGVDIGDGHDTIIAAASKRRGHCAHVRVHLARPLSPYKRLVVAPVPQATEKQRQQRLDELQRFVVRNVVEEVLAELEQRKKI